jgi:sarcosine oxidase subunit beta
MQEIQNVVIVGAGLVGLSVAYHLAAKGVTQVVVLDRESMWANGSSGRSAGGIRLEFSHPSSIKFSQYGLDVIRDFEDLFGMSASFNPCGYLFLTKDSRRWEKMRELAWMQQSLNVPVEVLAAQEIGRRFSYIDMSDLIGGTFCKEDGVADPGTVAYGFARRAQELGVEIRLGTEVIGITVEQGRIAGVLTTEGPIRSACVVNAAGPLAKRIGAMAGIDIPVLPYRRSIYVTDAFDGLPAEMPVTLEFETTSYIRREGQSILMGMSDPNEPSSENIETDTESLEKLITTVLSWVPSLEKASIMRGWAGLYEVSPDDSAIIGEVEERPGFYCANGFSGHGFMHSPAAGRVIAELIAGETPFVDITPFKLERFRNQRETPESFVI